MIAVGMVVHVHAKTVCWYCAPIAPCVCVTVESVQTVTEETYVAPFHRAKRHDLRMHVYGYDTDGKRWEFWTTDTSEISPVHIERAA